MPKQSNNIINIKSETHDMDNAVLEKLKRNNEIDIITPAKNTQNIEESLPSTSNGIHNAAVVVKNHKSSSTSESKDTSSNATQSTKSEPEVLFKILNTYTITDSPSNLEMDEESCTKSNGRKRKRINYASLVEGENLDDFPTEDSVPTVIQPEIGKRKRGRPAGYKKKPKVEDSEATYKAPPEPEVVKKRGRPRGRFSPRSTHYDKLVNTIVQDLNSTVVSSETDPNLSQSSALSTEGNGDPNTVTCAVCFSCLAKSAWTQHKYRNHNNLAWRVGESPLDLSDSALVMRILTDLYKRKKPLYCENCDVPKKSVVGYISHKSVCQKSVNEVEATKIKCEHCGRSLMPVSMPVHLKTCRVLNADKQMDETQLLVTENEIICGKRRAATKANSFIKDLQENEALEETKKNLPPEQIRFGDYTVKLQKRTWYVNFDFKPTAKSTKVIQDEINKKGNARCWFEECNFECANVDEMTCHIANCQFKPSQGYTCQYCFVTYECENEVVEHSKQQHSGVVKDEDFNFNDQEQDNHDDINVLDFLEETKMKVVHQPIKRNILNGIRFLARYRYFPNSAPLLYPPAYEWTYKFCTRNFCQNNLFSHWRLKSDGITKLELSELSKYLPLKKYSVCTASIQEKTYTNLLALNYVWKRYKLFESELMQDTPIIFCGGPVTAMAWLPTPYNEENAIQILAVSSNSNFNKRYPIHQLYEESGLIQFWNCGTLNNFENVVARPILQFCLVHDHGPVWCLEWCPSGCYDQELQSDCAQRLGLLAVGSGDSYTYIYSISLPDSKSGKMLRIKPVLKLALSYALEISVNGIEPHVTKLSWTRAARHEYLAAGYANGMVGIFYLNSTSPLLYGKPSDDIKVLLPYQTVIAHYHAVTALHLYHLNDGRRWLMTGSLDRSIKYWDLQNPLIPLSNFTKFIVRDGVWLNNWLSVVHTYEDCCGGGLTQSTIHQVRNYECSGSSILHSNSCVSTISGSDWSNSFIQGNAAGEISGFFPHQLFYSLDNDKSFRIKKGVLGYARLIEKNLSVQERLKNEKAKSSKVKQTASNSGVGMNVKSEVLHKCSREPTNYEEADDKYGLAFCHLEIESVKELPVNLKDYYSSNTDKFYPATPNIYPLQSINKIVINPNSTSYYYYATGYESGFVRISNMKSLGKHNTKKS